MVELLFLQVHLRQVCDSSWLDVLISPVLLSLSVHVSIAVIVRVRVPVSSPPLLFHSPVTIGSPVPTGSGASPAITPFFTSPPPPHPLTKKSFASNYLPSRCPHFRHFSSRCRFFVCTYIDQHSHSNSDVSRGCLFVNSYFIGSCSHTVIITSPCFVLFASCPSVLDDRTCIFDPGRNSVCGHFDFDLGCHQRPGVV